MDTNLDLVLLEYRNLHEYDKENAALFQDVFKKCLSEKSGIGQKHQAGLRNVSLVGSCFEGTLLAKCFMPTELGFNNEIECDIEFNLMEITEEFKDMVEDLEGKIGYVRLTVDRRMITFSREAGWEVNDEDFNKYIPSGYLDESNHLRTYVIKEEILRRVKFEKVDEYVQLMAAAVLGEKLEDVEISLQKQVITKSSIENSLHVLIKNDLKFKISWDIVAVIKLSWWPKIANEWITRTREWPDKETVKKLSDFSYIVIKLSDEEKVNLLATELRYSFTHIEGELMKLRNEQQKFVYFIFKCMFYKWLKPLDETKLHSFIVKTVMFWSCERFPPNHDLWKDDAESVCFALKHLFDRLKSAIEADFLSYYFIREINVLSEIDGDLKIKVLKKINLFLSDFKGHVMLDIASILSFGCEVASTLEKWFTENVINKGLRISRRVSDLNLKDLLNTVEDVVNQSYRVVERVKKVNSSVTSKQYENEAETAIDSATNISCKRGMGIAAYIDVFDDSNDMAQSITETLNKKKD